MKVERPGGGPCRGFTPFGPQPGSIANGFGAGFLTLSLLAALAGIAAFLVAVAVAAALLRRRRGRVPRLVGPVAIGLGLLAIVVAAFGVLALVDEAAVGAAVFVAAVYVPLAAVWGRTRGSPAGPRSRLATAALAWSGPYLLAVVAFVGTNAAVPGVLDLAPAEPGSAGVGWLAVAAAGVVATGGALALGDRLGGVLHDG